MADELRELALAAKAPASRDPSFADPALMFLAACTPDAILDLYRERDEARGYVAAYSDLALARQSRAEAAEAKAALAAMGEREAVGEAVKAERERCAKLVEPTHPRPCDCDRCYCDKTQDAEQVAAWDEAARLAAAIRSGEP